MLHYQISLLCDDDDDENIDDDDDDDDDGADNKGAADDEIAMILFIYDRADVPNKLLLLLSLTFVLLLRALPIHLGSRFVCFALYHSVVISTEKAISSR